MKKEMKNIMIFLTVILVILILPNKAKAYSNNDFINVDYDNILISDTMSINKDFFSFMNDNLISHLDNAGYDYLININMRGMDNYLGIDMVEYCVTQKQNHSDDFLIRSYFDKEYLSGLSGKPNDLIKRFYCYSSVAYSNGDYTEDNIYSFISSQSFSNDPVISSHMDYYVKIFKDWSFVNSNIYDNLKFGFNSCYSIIYKSNVDIKTTSHKTSGTYVPITFNGENKALVGDKFYTYLDINPINFDKNYSTADYTKVVFDFDFNSINSSSGDLFNLFLTTTELIPDNSSGFYYSSPYIEYKYKEWSCDSENSCSTGLHTYTDIQYISDLTNVSGQDSYIYALSNDFYLNKDTDMVDGGKYITDIKLVVLFDTRFTSTINVVMSSNLSYTYTEYTNETYSNSLTELDLTGKYGALLLPVNRNDNFTSNFRANGKFLLELRDSYDTTNYNIEKVYTYGFCDALYEDNVYDYNCSLSDKFSMTFNYNNNYQVLGITNLDYQKNTQALFYYDSSKFELYVINESNSVITITNPITNETYDYNNLEYSNNSKSSVSVNYLINLINNFMDSNDNVVSFLQNVLYIFFEDMPPYIYQCFLVLVFIIFLVVLVAIAGWK